MLKVVIEVSGGVAYATSVPDGVKVEIIDHDNAINGTDAELSDLVTDYIGGK